MKRLAIILLIALIAVIGATRFYDSRNPERLVLADSAREAAGGRYVQLSDGITHYQLLGRDIGRVVVLVHGFSVPYYIWDSTAFALSKAGYRVLRYDLYGRGYSDRPDVAYSSDLFDRQLLELLDSLHLTDRIDLAGLSMGGIVAGTFAAQHAARLRTLTLIDPAAGGRPKLPFTLRIPGIRGYLWQTTHMPNAAEGQSSDFSDPKQFPDWAERYRPQMRYRGFGRALMSTTIEAARIDRDSVYARVGATGVPALLIWGKRDRTVPFELSDGVRKAMPNAEFRPIPGAGHLPVLEQGTETNALIIRFLSVH
jgi:pimeloyl-ACP methyl ester carboxylesterase